MGKQWAGLPQGRFLPTQFVMNSLFAKSIRRRLGRLFPDSGRFLFVGSETKPFRHTRAATSACQTHDAQISPQPKKIIPQAKKLASPYELRAGCYNFDGKWYFALYSQNDEGELLVVFGTKTPLRPFTPGTLIFDPENFKVTHESSIPGFLRRHPTGRSVEGLGSCVQSHRPEARSSHPEETDSSREKDSPKGVGLA